MCKFQVVSISIFLILCGSSVLSGQTDSIPDKKSIKIYTNYTSGEESTSSRYFDYDKVNPHEIGKLSIGLSIPSGNNFHELILTDFKFIVDPNTYYYAIGSGYSYNIKVSDNYKSDKLKFFIGLQALSSFRHQINEAHTTFTGQAYYANQTRSVLLSTNVIGRLIYRFNNIFYLELNGSLRPLTFEMQSREVQNPLIREENQTTTTFDAIFIPEVFNASLGLGYNF